MATLNLAPVLYALTNVKNCDVSKINKSNSSYEPQVLRSSVLGSNSKFLTFNPLHNRFSLKPNKLSICANLEQQIKEMKMAERRWERQVAEGKIKSLSAKEAGYACQLSGHKLLDVRPSSERSRSYVKGSLWVPAFDTDKGLSPSTVLNKFTNFTMGGWWSGTSLTKRNERFMADVVSQLPDKSVPIIVACQKGLRSLAACEQLYKAGYRNLFWLNGGFDVAEDGDFEVEGNESLKMAGIGGVSKFIGWTDVQRAQAKKEGLSYRLKLFARLVILVLACDALFVGIQKLLEITRQ